MRLEFYVWIPDYFAGKRWCEFFVMRLGQAICQFINFQEIREDWSVEYVTVDVLDSKLPVSQI